MARIRVMFLVAISLVGAWAFPAVGVERSEATDKSAVADQQQDEEYYELYKSFADALDQVERNYVKGISRRELMEAAIKGMLSKLDPYSNYISPKEISRFKTSIESEFGGIGIQITLDGGQLKVLSPLVGSPAYKAGLQAGDRILEIDGETTDDIKQLDDAVARLKGKAGSTVKVTIVHDGSTDRHEVEIEREVVQVETVMGDRRNDRDEWDFMFDPEQKIGYVRLTAFSRNTAEDLERALKQLDKDEVKGLVLDLRFNPGGLLSSAIEICDMFISKGRIVSTEGRNSKPRKWDAHKSNTYEGFPMAVLVNRYSASASEIVSACLQDHDRAIVVGERTWGKGSVQNVIQLEGGNSALKLTTASYQRPSGKKIHRFPEDKDSDEWGVTPNDGYLLRLSGGELRALVTDRRERDIVRVHSKETPKDAGDEEPSEEGSSKGEDEPTGGFVDRQLQQALKYLADQLALAK